MSCIFCKLIAGELPASVIHRDDTMIIFMDIAPITRGHCLVVPLEHHKTLHSLDPAVRQRLFDYGVAISSALRDQRLPAGLACDGVHYHLNEGKHASQIVPHVHLHIMPRRKGDRWRFANGIRKHVLSTITGGRLGSATRAKLDADGTALRDVFMPPSD